MNKSFAFLLGLSLAVAPLALSPASAATKTPQKASVAAKKLSKPVAKPIIKPLPYKFANIEVWIGDQKSTFGKVVEYQGKYLLPIKPYLQSEGYEIKWDAKTKTLTADDGFNVLKFKQNSKSLAITSGDDSETFEMGHPAIIINGTMYAPVRWVAIAMGLEAELSEDKTMINLYEIEYEEEPVEDSSPSEEETYDQPDEPEPQTKKIIIDGIEHEFDETGTYAIDTV